MTEFTISLDVDYFW